MIEGLVGGNLWKSPEQRTAKITGRSYVYCMVRTPMKDRDPIVVNVTAFDEGVCRALMALDDGDAVALAGPLTVRAWTDKKGEIRPGLDMVAVQLLTPYHVSHKRRAMEAQPYSNAQKTRAEMARGEIPI